MEIKEQKVDFSEGKWNFARLWKGILTLVEHDARGFLTTDTLGDENKSVEMRPLEPCLIPLARRRIFPQGVTLCP